MISASACLGKKKLRKLGHLQLEQRERNAYLQALQQVKLRTLVHSQLEQRELCICESFKTSQTDHTMRHHAVGVTDRSGILKCEKMKEGKRD